MSASSTLRLLITGSSSDAEAAFAQTAAAADASADEMSGKFDNATKDVGGFLSRIGQSMENASIPFGSAVSGMGEKMDEAKSHGKGLQQAMNDLGGATLAVGAVALAGVAAESIHLATTFQTTVTSIAANAGITVAAAQKIGTAFLDTAGTTIYSGQEIGTAYAAVAAQLGATQGKALDSAQAMQVMAAAMDLAEGSGTSLNSSVADLANVMQVYGIKADGAAKASDQLFQAARLSGNTLDSISQAIARMHTQLGVVTPSLGQTGALLVDLAEHGQVGSRAIRAVSTAMTALLKPTEAQATAQANLTTVMNQLPPSLRGLAAGYLSGTASASSITAATKNLSVAQAESWKQFTTAAGAVDSSNLKYQELGVTVTNAQGKFVGIGSVIDQLHTKIEGMTQAQALATLSQVFGAKAAGQLYATVKAGPAAFDRATASVMRANAAHQAAEKQSQTLQHQIELMKATVEDYGTKLGDALLPKIESVIHATADVVNWFMRHKAVAEVLAGVIGGVLAASVAVYAINTGTKMVGSVKAAIESVGKLIGLFGGQSAATLTASESMQEQNATMAESSVYFKQVAASAKLQAQYEGNLTEVTRVQTEAAETLAESNATLTESYATLAEATSVLPEGFAAVGDAEEALAATSAETGEASTMALGPIGIAIMAVAAVGMLVVTHWKQISKYLEDAWRFVDKLAHKIWGGLKDFFKKWGEDLLLAFLPVVGIPVFLATHWHKVEDDAKEIWGDVVSFVKSIPDRILDALEDLGTDVENLAKSAWGMFLTGIKGEWKDVTDWLGDLWSSITGAIGDLGSKVETWVKQEWGYFLTGLKIEWRDVTSWLGDLWSSITSAIGDLGGKVETWVKQEWGHFLSGIKDAWKDVTNWLGNLGQDILTAIGDLSKLLDKVGHDILEGLLNGMKDAWKDVTGFLSGIGSSIAGFIKDPLKVLSPSRVMHEIGSNIMEGLANGIAEAYAGKVAPALKIAAAGIAGQQFTLGAIGTTVASAVAAGGTSNPSSIGAAQPATGTTSTSDLPPMPLTVVLQVGTQQLAQALLPDIRTGFLQEKRSVVTLGLS